MARIRTHPGEVLREEFIEAARLSANALTLALRAATRIGDILRGEHPRSVSADTAIRLARYFGVDGRILAELQSSYDLLLTLAERGPTIARDVRPREETAA